MEGIRLLLIEDNPGDVRLLKEMLKELSGFDMEQEGTLSAGLSRLTKDGFGLLLLDLGLPDSQGLETIRRAVAAMPGLPIIVFTGLDDEEVGVKAIQAGAQDYLVKGQVSPQLLGRTMRHALERKRLEAEIQRLATTDTLTGIANRRKFYEILDREISKSKRYGTSFSLIMYDLDHFKTVNDVFGHDTGDEVLKRVAHVVEQNIRKEDVHARWGGEEFMVLTPSQMAAAMALSEKLRSKIEAHEFGPVEKVTVSLGVTKFEPGDDAASLVRKADEALYMAKQKGRNRVESVI